MHTRAWRRAVIAALAVAALVATPAVGASSTPPAGTAWVQVDGDLVVPVDLVGRLGARAAGEGYDVVPSTTGNLGSYDIRLGGSTGIESVRPDIEEAAAEIEEATGGDMRVLAGTTDAAEAERGEILIVVSSTSPCSTQIWIGCAGVQTVSGSVPNLIATSGKVWLHPDVLDLDHHNRQHVVSHEIGHALGLVHYDALHDGQLQVMHTDSYDARSYRSGDLAGLRYLHDGGPSVPSNDRFASPHLFTEALPSTLSGTTHGAGRESGEPQHAGEPGGASVWFSWTAALSDEVTFEVVDASFDTVAAVYRGSSLQALTEVASNDDGAARVSLSAVRFDAVAGVTYRIALDGADGDRGQYTIRMRPWAAGPFSSDVSFVRRQYRDFLGAGRPTVAELLIGVAALQSGDATAGDVIVSLARHDERMASLGPVTRLYMAYFRRTPDTAGLQYWISRHQRGATLSSISSSFAASSEFTSTYGELGPDAFVELVYENVLGRSPDTGGALFWVGQLLGGRTRGWLMTQFSESTENVRANAAEVDVVSLRLGMLGSVPPADLFQANVRELENGNPLQQIAGRILTGGAYAERFGF